MAINKRRFNSFTPDRMIPITNTAMVNPAANLNFVSSAIFPNLVDKANLGVGGEINPFAIYMH